MLCWRSWWNYTVTWPSRHHKTDRSHRDVVVILLWDYRLQWLHHQTLALSSAYQSKLLKMLALANSLWISSGQMIGYYFFAGVSLWADIKGVRVGMALKIWILLLDLAVSATIVFPTRRAKQVEIPPTEVASCCVDKSLIIGSLSQGFHSRPTNLACCAAEKILQSQGLLDF